MLTSRQLEILALVAQGLQNKTIAKRLGISRKTVEAHLFGAFQRLGVRNRTAAAIAYRELRASVDEESLASQSLRRPNT